MAPPPGWYRDPNGEFRWWDGTAWTAHTRPAPGPTPAPDANPAVAAPATPPAPVDPAAAAPRTTLDRPAGPFPVAAPPPLPGPSPAGAGSPPRSRRGRLIAVVAVVAVLAAAGVGVVVVRSRGGDPALDALGQAVDEYQAVTGDASTTTTTTTLPAPTMPTAPLEPANAAAFGCGRVNARLDAAEARLDAIVREAEARRTGGADTTPVPGVGLDPVALAEAAAYAGEVATVMADLQATWEAVRLQASEDSAAVLGELVYVLRRVADQERAVADQLATLAPDQPAQVGLVPALAGASEAAATWQAYRRQAQAPDFSSSAFGSALASTAPCRRAAERIGAVLDGTTPALTSLASAR